MVGDVPLTCIYLMVRRVTCKGKMVVTNQDKILSFVSLLFFPDQSKIQDKFYSSTKALIPSFQVFCKYGGNEPLSLSNLFNG